MVPLDDIPNLSFIPINHAAVADAVIRNMDELKADGQRMKFPAKSGCHQGRWCSGSLKAAVQDSVTGSLGKKGERFLTGDMEGDGHNYRPGRYS